MKYETKKTGIFLIIVSCSLLIVLSCENPLLKDFFNQRTVTYHSNGGNAVAPQKLIRDDKIKKPADPGKEGYVFDGWYEDNGTFNLLWNFDITPSSNLTLYAKWKEIDGSGCNHQWGGWYVTLLPTCIAAGIETRYCVFDDIHTETREIPIDPNAHHWVGVDGEGVAPTCTTDGHGKVHCERCGEKADNIPALGHDKGEWHITLEPTCMETGIRELLCTRDEEVLEVEVIDALGHDWGEWVVTTPATFVSTGEETRTCRRCGEIETRIIPLIAAITNTAEWVEVTTAIQTAPTGSYVLNIQGNIGITGYNAATFGTTAANNTLTITLQGTGKLYLTGQGRMFHIGGRQTLIIDSLTLEGLKNGQNGSAQDNNDSLVYIAVGGTAELRNGTITGNYGAKNGGGVMVEGGTFTLDGGAIKDNTAYTSGGGVYIDTGGECTMSGGEISGNNATNETGGGVSVTDGKFIMNGGSIKNNHADNDSGGGVNVGSNGAFTMKSGAVIESNTASFGGGINISYGTFTLDGGAIKGNTAYTEGGGVFSYAATFDMSGGEINGNISDEDGGGVFMRLGAFTMSGGVIKNNEANNGSGGGAVITGMGTNRGTFTMSNDAVIEGNTASGNGGGVFIYANGDFTMNGGTIADNEAYTGGGVYVFTGGTVTLDGGAIKGNTASLYGGGVQVGVNGDFVMSGGEISGNTAYTGGGVYVADGTFRIVTGTIYGNEGTVNPADLKNTVYDKGAALFKSGAAGAAQYGDGSTWNNLSLTASGSDGYTDTTLRYVNGAPVP